MPRAMQGSSCVLAPVLMHRAGGVGGVSSTPTHSWGHPVFPSLLQVGRPDQLAEGLMKDSRAAGRGGGRDPCCAEGPSPETVQNFLSCSSDPESQVHPWSPHPGPQQVHHPKGSILQGQRSESSCTERAKCSQGH